MDLRFRWIPSPSRRGESLDAKLLPMSTLTLRASWKIFWNYRSGMLQNLKQFNFMQSTALRAKSLDCWSLNVS